MTGSPVRIGPFSGGLNTYNDPTAIGDTECSNINNFDIDIDGSVVNRPPLQLVPTTGATGAVRFLGIFTDTTGKIFYITVDGANLVRSYDPINNTFTTIIANTKINDMAQYQNKAWLVADTTSVNPGGSWDGTTFIALAAIPRGISALIYKERLHVASGKGAVNSSRITFSNPGNITTWTGTDFVDVSNGDGQNIVKIYSYSGVIVVFKQDSTYTFGYDTAPAKGVVQMVSGSIGISSPYAMNEYENIIYVIHQDFLYAIVNWRWDLLNVKVPFTFYQSQVRASWLDFSISVVGIRLIIKFYDNFYIYNIRLRSFTYWSFTLANYSPAFFIKYPIVDNTTFVNYWAGGYDGNSTSIYKFADTRSGAVGETFTCSLTTKTYDFQAPYTFKRLFWWGCDLLAKTMVTFKVTPTIYNIPVKWSQLSGLKWSVLKSWRRPIDVALDVTDSATLTNPSGIRTFVKLLKSLRFRQVSFTISSTVDGTPVTGPFKIFSVTAFTSNKELVTKKLS